MKAWPLASLLLISRTAAFTGVNVAALRVSSPLSSLQNRRNFRAQPSILMAAADKSDSEWRAVLSPAQFRVLRQKGTEPPGSSEYDKFYPQGGAFTCIGCEAPLYKASAKFDSGCGWPAFYEGFPGAIKEVPDADGMRIEILCNNCGGHLGHVFKGEGFPTPTNARHCVNGITLKFTPAK